MTADGVESLGMIKSFFLCESCEKPVSGVCEKPVRSEIRLLRVCEKSCEKPVRNL